MDDKSQNAPNKLRNAGMSRREFARRAAIASAVASIAPASTLSADASIPATGRVAEKPAVAHASNADAPAAQQPKLSPESQAEVEARIQSILGVYGSRFSEEQKADLRRLCAAAQPPLDRLRAYALENGAASALYLKPLVERDKDPLAGTRKGKTPSTAKKKS
jgi:hypothetical protein